MSYHKINYEFKKKQSFELVKLDIIFRRREKTILVFNKYLRNELAEKDHERENKSK